MINPPNHLYPITAATAFAKGVPTNVGDFGLARAVGNVEKTIQLLIFETGIVRKCPLLSCVSRVLVFARKCSQFFRSSVCSHFLNGDLQGS
jgi:hypothetical protein